MPALNVLIVREFTDYEGCGRPVVLRRKRAVRCSFVSLEFGIGGRTVSVKYHSRSRKHNETRQYLANQRGHANHNLRWACGLQEVMARNNGKPDSNLRPHLRPLEVVKWLVR